MNLSIRDIIKHWHYPTDTWRNNDAMIISSLCQKDIMKTLSLHCVPAGYLTEKGYYQYPEKIRITHFPFRCQHCVCHGLKWDYRTTTGSMFGSADMQHQYIMTWWRHQMETFSTLLAICAGNSLVPGEFPTHLPVTRSFNVFFDLHLNQRLSKQSWGWWFETLRTTFITSL